MYPFHGVRQYTPRNISKISGLFSDFSETYLYELGGENSKKAHAKFINTGLLNRDIRIQNEEIYERICYNAIKNDFEKHQTNMPNFYALVIKTKS